MFIYIIYFILFVMNLIFINLFDIIINFYLKIVFKVNKRNKNKNNKKLSDGYFKCGGELNIELRLIEESYKIVLVLFFLL